MEVLTISWVADPAAPESWFVPDLLEPFGFTVKRYPPGGDIDGTVDLRLLAISDFSSRPALVDEIFRDPRPALVLSNSLITDIDVFDLLREGDEIVDANESVEILARRLRQLARRHRANLAEGTAGTGGMAVDRIPMTDSLTGLPNRGRFNDELRRAIAELRTENATGVLFLDIDRFKQVNDVFGHSHGDDVLARIAGELLRERAPTDCFARFGGDEFVCILTRYDEETLCSEAQRIVDRIAAVETPVGDETVRVTVSAGLARINLKSDPESIVKQADIAMYQAKQAGRGRLVHFKALEESLADSDEDPALRHFQNVTRVLNERLANQISIMGRRLVQAARREATEDGLTHLKNRGYFDSRIKREIENVRKRESPLTIALMDLDNFGSINREYLWPSGDRVLRRFAEVATDNVRLVDWIARYGGEEFCVVMPDTDIQEGAAVAERLRAQVEACQVQAVDGRSIAFTVSIGVAQLDADIASAEDLVERAAQALLSAKRSGRNRVVIATKDGDARNGDTKAQGTSPLA